MGAQDVAGRYTGTLALFVGFAAAARIQDLMSADGFGDLRFSHGYVFQHLVDAEPTVGELAVRMGVTQQGASKALKELESLGYAGRIAGAGDARTRRVRLTRRGTDAETAARHARTTLQDELAERYGRERLEQAHGLLAELLDGFGGAAAVRRREVRRPR